MKSSNEARLPWKILPLALFDSIAALPLLADQALSTKSSNIDFTLIKYLQLFGLMSPIGKTLKIISILLSFRNSLIWLWLILITASTRQMKTISSSRNYRQRKHKECNLLLRTWKTKKWWKELLAQHSASQAVTWNLWGICQYGVHRPSWLRLIVQLLSLFSITSSKPLLTPEHSPPIAN